MNKLYKLNSEVLNTGTSPDKAAVAGETEGSKLICDIRN